MWYTWNEYNAGHIKVYLFEEFGFYEILSVFCWVCVCININTYMYTIRVLGFPALRWPLILKSFQLSISSSHPHPHHTQKLISHKFHCYCIKINSDSGEYTNWLLDSLLTQHEHWFKNASVMSYTCACFSVWCQPVAFVTTYHHSTNL